MSMSAATCASGTFGFLIGRSKSWLPSIEPLAPCFRRKKRAWYFFFACFTLCLFDESTVDERSFKIHSLRFFAKLLYLVLISIVSGKVEKYLDRYNTLSSILNGRSFLFRTNKLTIFLSIYSIIIFHSIPFTFRFLSFVSDFFCH